MRTERQRRGVVLGRRSIAHHSKSFALASRLLPAASRDDVAVVYAWCRRADDAVDEAPAHEHGPALARLRGELDAIYAGREVDDDALAAFQRVVHERGVPRWYPDELLAGMAMDASGFRYRTIDDLVAYSYRAAGTVGLMMCHVLGVDRPQALRHAAHLGIAMQITNVCRDVAEDWGRGRLYLPEEVLAERGARGLSEHLGGPLPAWARAPIASAVEGLLARADLYYASGDAGLPMLSSRSAFAVRAARLIYSEIGRVLARRAYDPLSGRARVRGAHKLALLLRAALDTLRAWPSRAPRSARPIRTVARLGDVVAIGGLS